MLASVKFRGNMRWRGDAVFSRPLRWLLALHGAVVVPVAFAGLRAGRNTTGLRSHAAPEIQVLNHWMIVMLIDIFATEMKLANGAFISFHKSILSVGGTRVWSGAF